LARNAKPLLVIGGPSSPQHRAWAEQEFNIQVWDRDELLRRAGRMHEQFVAFFAEIDLDAKQRARFQEARIDAPELPLEEPEGAIPTDETPTAIGPSIIERLRTLKPGKQQAKKYELLCRDIIEYIFGNDLRDGRSQQHTHDQLNFYDIIYRIRPTNSFWTNLSRDFRARAILFECKNYNKGIGPMQVFMTERYLSSNTLRPICFILSRTEPHRHAVQAAFGAMRDSGKLLIFLSDKDLIQMIGAKDTQIATGGSHQERIANDPTELLDQKIYDFIASIPR
jgi:hypothetical protein